MKTLPERFQKYGYELTQIKREGNIAIYRNEKHGSTWFDVIVIQKHDGYTVAGKYIDPSEIYPSPEQWGAYGWTVKTYKAALEKFNQLTTDHDE